FAEPTQDELDEPERNGCCCAICMAARDAGCADPDTCHIRASEELDALGEKWDPRSPLP
ncbi:hypothetical protein DFP72DRAFT_758991, partial [Ephemerocybe angulata]